MNMFNGCFRAHQNHCTVHPYLHYTVLYCTVYSVPLQHLLCLLLATVLARAREGGKIKVQVHGVKRKLTLGNRKRWKAGQLKIK